MTRQHWVIGISAGGLVALLAATAITFIDWRLNPGGVFHGQAGTDWKIVWETWSSWCAPVFLVTSGIAIAVLWWTSART